MRQAERKEKAREKLKDRWWRLNNLYHIVDKNGNKVKFKPNWAQHDLYDNLWYCNIILKARQLGMSSMCTIIFLDACLFNSNVSAGIIAHTRDDAKIIFKKVRFAYENIPEELRKYLAANTDSANELVFANGSSIRVGTSMRSSSLQYLHISEFGKICRKFPDKAQEIITGSLNTVTAGQHIFIESTAEGREGYFYDMCQEAIKNQDKEEVLTKLDFKFHFYPWWKHPDYHIEDTAYIVPEEDEQYYRSLHEYEVNLTEGQKTWYSKKKIQQQDNMSQEYPSTPEEAFLVNTEGLYYGKQMRQVYTENRVTNVYYDYNVPVHTAWDFGYSDFTAIWFFQLVGQEIHLIDYIEGSGEALTYYIKMIKEKPYTYGSHYVPHDAKVHEYSTGMTRIELAQKQGLVMEVTAKLSIQEGIDAARNLLHRCWFDEKKTGQGIKCLENYTKRWNESLGAYSDQPLHNDASHGADAFRVLALNAQVAHSGHMSEDEALRLERLYRR